MPTVNILEAEMHLSSLVEAFESGAQTEIVITRNGKPVARLVPVAPEGKRLGLLEGRYPSSSQNEFDAYNADIAGLFERSA